MHRKLWFPLALGLVLLVGSLMPATSTAAPVRDAAAARTSTSARTTLTSTQFEQRLLALVNARRSKVGCRALRSNRPLVRAARSHTRRMVAAGNLSHQLPGEPGLARRIVKAGYRNWTAAAENIAWGSTSPKGVYSMWMRSAGHRANIQKCRYRDAGVGVVIANGTPWVTLDFGRRR